MKTHSTVHTERVDDVPLLLTHMQRLHLFVILDTHFSAHGNHQELSLEWIVLI